MDYLEQPGIKETYNKCKLIVKVWEHNFTKKYKRIPSKLDIREASRDVRNAYRKYFQLKTAALEESFRDIEGFEIDEDVSQSFSMDLSQQSTAEQFDTPIKDVEHTPIETPKPLSPLQERNDVPNGVWGTHLNNKKKDDEKEKNEKKDNPNLSITKKLFCGSKFTKRNPRKSLSFSHKTKSNISVDDDISLSQPITNNRNYTSATSLSQPLLSFESFNSFDIDDNTAAYQNESWFGSNAFKIDSGVDVSKPQPINIIQCVLENNYKQLKNVDKGWLQRVAQINGIQVNDNDFPTTNNPSSSIADTTSFSSTSELCKGIENTKLDYDSEDIIEESDDETCSKDFTSLHILKKRKIEPPVQKISSYPAPSSSNLPPNRESVTPIQSHVETDNCMDVEDYEKIVGKSKHSENIETNEMINNELNANPKEVSIIETAKDVKEANKIKSPSLKVRKGKSNNKIKKPKEKSSTKSSKKQRPASTKKTKNSVEPTGKNKQDHSPRRSTRETRVKVNLQEFSSGEEDPFANDDETDPDFGAEKKTRFGVFNSEDEELAEEEITETVMKETPSRKKKEAKTAKKKEIKTTKKTPVPKKSASLKKKMEGKTDETEEDEQEMYDLEFSVKRRIVTPRYTNLKKILSDKKIETIADTTETIEDSEETPQASTLVKGKRQQARELLEKKIASGKLNDNFVRIDLKKKVYVKGNSGVNFRRYKKSQWKAAKAKALSGPDMDMGGCDGGMLTCFNCGQIGHFARNCKATKGDSLLPKTAEMDAEDDMLPTLEQASQMAQGALKIRTPQLNPQGKNKDQSDEEAEETVGDRIIDCSQEENDNEDDGFDSDGLDSELLLESMKLEEEVRKLDVQQYLDKVKVVVPYYQTNEDGSIIATPPEVYEVLNKFGHTSFRSGQERAIMRILSGKSTLVTLSTGSGKSLCYQLPAYMYSRREPCISLIISPLVSLMDDQVMGIAKFMKAACLHSNQTKIQRQKILEMITNGELSVLLVSPEAVVAGERQTGFGSFLRKLPPIAFACIDEAHCVSQWSHNFRPSYLMICRVLRESLGVQTILGLTATATRATRESIIEHLCIPDGDDGVISDIPIPDNLTLTVSKDGQRDHALLELLMSERFSDCKSIIIYCTRRDECERVAAFLRTCLKCEQPVPPNDKKRKRVNLQAEPYHAGLSASRRRTIQNSFMSGALRIVVATVAFGMGINKSDIRAVIHYNMPNSFESYVQEVGRAGRDGLKAHCHVFLNAKGRDENELRRHIHGNSIERHTIRKLLQKVFVPCSCKDVCSKHEVAFSVESTVRALDISEENISTLLCYLELHSNKYIEVLSPAYTWCKVISYGGPLQIRKVAKECPPLAMALALHKSKAGEDPNFLEFPVVEIASAMGWESGICKHKLKNLEWITVNNQPKRSAISVQLSDLGFRLLAPGNLTGEQLDEALDSLYNRVVDQERKALLQLKAVHKTLREVAKTTFKSCLIGEDDCLLKKRIREYFNSSDPLSEYTIEEPKPFNEERLVNDIRTLINMYKDNNFTGRAIARIFQGIQSPNYPAVIWGRCKFWRSYLDTDFHAIVKIATREIIAFG